MTFWEEEENEAADVEDFAAAWGENVTDDHNITLLEDIPLSLRATDGDEVRNVKTIDLKKKKKTFFFIIAK